MIRQMRGGSCFSSASLLRCCSDSVHRSPCIGRRRGRSHSRRQQTDFVRRCRTSSDALTSMRHLTELLASNSITNEERKRHYYELLAHETERLHRMVDSLLSFGRMSARDVCLAVGVRGNRRAPWSAVVDEFRRDAAAEHRTVTSEVDADLPGIRADRDALSRALWNLLRMRRRISSPPLPYMSSPVVRETQSWWVSRCRRRNSGVRARAHFQKFVRGGDATRAGVRGVGIGLALVTRIAGSAPEDRCVSRAGPVRAARSRWCFHVSNPDCRGRPCDCRGAHEDDLRLEELRRADREGHEALAATRASAFDLLLLDVMLPKGRTGSTCTASCAAPVWTSILLLTARGGETDKVLGLDLGADDYIANPPDPKELRARCAPSPAVSRSAPGHRVPGDCEFDLGQTELRRDRKPVATTPLELKL